MPAVLIIGASEVAMFSHCEDYIRREWEVDEVRIDSQSGRTLPECIPVIRQRMDANVGAVLIWALTPLAWQRRVIRPGIYDGTIFVPKEDFSLNQVPEWMTEIVHCVMAYNPRCRVFLVLPALKDFYTFNQKRVGQSVGLGRIDMYENHQQFGPIPMRDFGIYSYEKFMELGTDMYDWPYKFTIKANHAINKYFGLTPTERRTGNYTPPHQKYLLRQTTQLGLDIMPDGLHGDLTFAKCFVRGHRSSMKWALRAAREVLLHHPRLPVPPPSQERLLEIPDQEEVMVPQNQEMLDQTLNQESTTDMAEAMVENADVTFPQLPDEEERNMDLPENEGSGHQQLTVEEIVGATAGDADAMVQVRAMSPYPQIQPMGPCFVHNPNVSTLNTAAQNQQVFAIRGISPAEDRALWDGILALVRQALPHQHTPNEEKIVIDRLVELAQYRRHQL